MCFFRSQGMTGWNFTAHFLEHKGKKDKDRMVWQQMVSRISVCGGVSFGIERRVVEMLASRVILILTCLECLYFLISEASSKGSWELKSCLTSGLNQNQSTINTPQKAPE